MPNDLYFNVNGTKPDVSGLPSVMQGMFAANQAEQYQRVMQMQEAMQKLSLQQEQENFTEGMPMRQAERGSKLDKFMLESQLSRGRQGMVPQTIAGEVGDAQTHQAAGALAMGRLGGDITAANADSGAKTQESNTKKNKSFLEHLDSMEPVFANSREVAPGVTAGSLAYQRWKQHLSPEQRDQVPDQYDPAAFKAIRNSLVNTPHMAQEIKKVEEQNKGHLAVAHETGMLGIEREKIKLKEKSKSYQQIMEKALTSGSDESVLRIEQMANVDPDVDPRTLLMIRSAGAQARRNIAVKTAKGLGPSIPGIGNPMDQANDIQQRLAQPGSNPIQNNKFQAGQTYTGKTGTYRYKGGDPASPQSWDKVQ